MQKLFFKESIRNSIDLIMSLSRSKYKVNVSFNFSIEIVEQDFSNFMENLEIDWFYPKINLDEAIKISTNGLFKKQRYCPWFEKK